MKELLLCSIWICATAQSKTTKCKQSCNVPRLIHVGTYGCLLELTQIINCMLLLTQGWSTHKSSVKRGTGCSLSAQSTAATARVTASCRHQAGAMPTGSQPAAVSSQGADLENGNHSEGDSTVKVACGWSLCILETALSLWMIPTIH